MAVNPIPDGYRTVTPYLAVKGANKVVEFMKKAFDAQAKVCHAQPDGTIMHAEVKVGDSMVMVGEACAEYGPRPSSIYLYVTDTDAVYNRAVQAGGKSLMKPANQFYGDRNAGVTDSAGNQWWIATHVEDVSPEEMRKRSEAHMKEHQSKAKPKKAAKPRRATVGSRSK